MASLSSSAGPDLWLKRSANGRTPVPVWLYAVRFRTLEPGALTSLPSWLER
jgi:hypothetical protein